jgi:phosphoglycerate dehydrogenase-like enzyme
MLDVGGCNEGAVAEEFEIGVATVGVAGAGRIGGLAVGVVEEFDAVLAFAT